MEREKLNAWSRRKITSFGKLTVIKPLIIHTVTHLFINLLDQDEKVFYDLNLLLYNFVSDGTHDKIKTCQAHEAVFFVCFQY